MVYAKKREDIMTKKKEIELGKTKKSIIYLLENPENVDFIKAMLSLKSSKELWRGVLAIPPGTLIEEIVREFEAKTDIPLEIPFFIFFHLMAGFLLYNKKNVVFKGETVTGGNVIPDIWSVILAPSGSGKSYSVKKLKGMIEDIDKFEFDATGIVSGAKFAEELLENNNKIFIRDEFNELYKAIQDDKGPLKDMKDYLLRIYDNGKISRKTKESEITIDETALVILGMTVDESFLTTISPDDIVNGFAQRFSFVIAEKDPKRKMIDYPIYNPDNSSWPKKWNALISEIVHDEYISTEETIQGYITAFRSLIKKDLPESFYRRILWKAHKYALIYHIIRGCGKEKNLTVEDYGWAARILYMHLQDAFLMLEKYGTSNLEKLITQAENFILKKKREGKDVTPRILVQGVKNIKTVAEAKGILSIINSKEESSDKRPKPLKNSWEPPV